MKEKEKKAENVIKIKQVALFECAIYQNVVNIATALMQAGRFVNIISTGSKYSVYIYERA